jgi:teichuronic acid exporter
LKDIKKKTVRGIAWTFIDRAGSQFIGFVLTIFLARLLSPSEFGFVAMASVVVAITRIFIDSGLNDSLIQKQDCTEEDYNTVFFFNMAMSIALFGVIFFSAPFVAQFFGYSELTPVIRILALKPAFASITFVQTAILHKQLKFGIIAKVRIPAFIVSGIIGLALAWYGYGVWALVWQSILETLFFAIFLWAMVDWRPSFLFSKSVFRFHWKHGSRLLVVNALGAIYRNIFSLIIGKFFSAAQLGFYSRADSFKTIILNNTTGLVQTVSYPVLTHFQNDNEKLKESYRKILQVTLFILLPIAAFFILGARVIIELLLTSKWLASAPILVVLMITLVFSPFNSINLNILKIKRRTDLLLKVDLINKIFLILIVVIAVKLGFDFLIYTNLLIALFALFVNNYFTNKLIEYSLKEQLSDYWPLLVSFVLTTGLVHQFSVYIERATIVWSVLLYGVIVLSLYVLILMLLRKKIIFTIYNEVLMLINIKKK